MVINAKRLLNDAYSNAGSSFNMVQPCVPFHDFFDSNSGVMLVPLSAG